MIKSSRKSNRSSRFFWFAVLAAIIGVGLWAFATSRTSPSAPILASNVDIAPEDPVYIPVAFDQASLNANTLSLSGTAKSSNRLRLYGQRKIGERFLLAELESGPNGRWQTLVDVSAFNEVLDPALLASGTLGGRAFSIDLEAIDLDETLIPAGQTLFVVQAAIMPIPPAPIQNGLVELESEAEPIQNAQAQSDLAQIQDELEIGYAILIMRPGGPSTVLRSPFGPSPAQDGLSLQAIDYDNAGGLIVNGRALGGGAVSVLANNTLIGETGISSAGEWTMIAGSTLPISFYDLTFIWRDEDGVERARLNMPFERFAPDTAFAPILGQSRMEGILARAGTWQLRRRLYGGGQQQSVIFAP